MDGLLVDWYVGLVVRKYFSTLIVETSPRALRVGGCCFWFWSSRVCFMYICTIEVRLMAVDSLDPARKENGVYRKQKGNPAGARDLRYRDLLSRSFLV